MFSFAISCYFSGKQTVKETFELKSGRAIFFYFWNQATIASVVNLIMTGFKLSVGNECGSSLKFKTWRFWYYTAWVQLKNSTNGDFTVESFKRFLWHNSVVSSELMVRKSDSYCSLS